MARLVQILDQDSGDVLLTIDAAISYVIEGEAEATDHPVEQGANITDHLRPKPRVLNLEGFISNTPVKEAAEGEEFPPDEPGAAEAAYMMLENRRLGGFLHSVVTKLDTFTSMALIRVSEPRSAQVGDALQFALVFKEIRVVQNQRVTIQTATAAGQPHKRQGTKTAEPVTPTTSNKTILKSGTDFLGLTTPGSGLP